MLLTAPRGAVALGRPSAERWPRPPFPHLYSLTGAVIF
jgi:hypothetical protein